jgi:hypothetical protein
MYDKHGNFGGSDWEHGTINGRAWYAIYGEMADWNYRYHGCLETTIEFDGPAKDPNAARVEDLWFSETANNRDALLKHLASGHQGVRGIVTSREQGVALRVTIEPGQPADDKLILVPPRHVGWNLVALPAAPTDPTPSAVFPGSNDIWAYDASQQRFFRPSTIRARTGYWVLDDGPAPRHLVAAGPAEGQPELEPGWNLIAPGWDGVYATGSRHLPLFGWSNENQVYRRLGAGDAVHASSGYWLYNSEDGSLLGAQEIPTISTNAPYPTYSDRGDGAALGDYFRLLEAGSHVLRFTDTFAAAIIHTPAPHFNAGNQTTIDARLTIPHMPLQLLLLDTPVSRDSVTGLWDHLRADVSLKEKDVSCQLYWRQGTLGDFTEATMIRASTDSPEYSAVISPVGAEPLHYYIEMTVAGSQTLYHPESGTHMIQTQSSRSVSVDSGVSSPTMTTDGKRSESLSKSFRHTAR